MYFTYVLYICTLHMYFTYVLLFLLVLCICIRLCYIFVHIQIFPVVRTKIQKNYTNPADPDLQHWLWVCAVSNFVNLCSQLFDHMRSRLILGVCAVSYLIICAVNKFFCLRRSGESWDSVEPYPVPGEGDGAGALGGSNQAPPLMGGSLQVQSKTYLQLHCTVN